MISEDLPGVLDIEKEERVGYACVTKAFDLKRNFIRRFKLGEFFTASWVAGERPEGLRLITYRSRSADLVRHEDTIPIDQDGSIRIFV